MDGILSEVAVQLGISIWVLMLLLTWSYVWKLLALWKSARKNSPVWFILLAIVNTMGILEILYIFVFSEMKTNNSKRKKMIKKRR